jgi:LPS-assembly protein
MFKITPKAVPVILIIAFYSLLSGSSFAEEEKTVSQQNSSPPATTSPAQKTDQSSDQQRKPLEVNGDRVEFFAEGKKMTAEGNVVIKYQDSKLTCRKVTVYSDTKDVYAEGDVHLYSKKGEIAGQNMKYNFDKQSGILYDAKFTAVPFYGAGKSIEKLNANEMLANQAYMTTCDLENPHYRLKTKQVQIFPGDKMVAKGVQLVIGKIPVFYIPQYIQSLSDKRPRLTMVPGYDKKWGAYLLQSWRFYFDENAKGTVHVDYRDRKGLAWGVDYSYKTPHTGEGLIRTYYTNEGSTADNFWVLDRGRIYRERFKAEWRHKWQIDPSTQAVWQYYKMKDKDFLQDYFKREFEKVPDPKSYFLLTRTLPSATLSFDVEKRVNHFFPATEMLPQLKLDTIDQKIGDSKFYFKNQTSYSNLSSKTGQPAATDPKGKQTQRVDSYNQLSHQEKIGIFEVRPYVATRQTYFSRDNSGSSTNLLRGIFYSGADLSTKFYRYFELETDYAGLDIHRLRHIVTPTLSYAYIHPPTISASKLTQFDDIDAIDRKNQVTIGLENKLQTKRAGSNVDLVRLAQSVDYVTKNKSNGGGRLQHLKSDLEIKPYNWLGFYSDSDFDPKTTQFESLNFDLGIDHGDKWNFGLGQRFQRDILNQTTISNQTTVEVGYRLNPKWKVRAYERFEAKDHTLKEQEYTIYRDLHCWTMEISFNRTEGEGSTVWFVFRIKAFPKLGLEINNVYHRRSTGTQNP